MYIDLHARKKKCEPKHKLQTFYGQLQHLFVVRLDDIAAHEDLGFEDDEPTTIFLAAIKTCVLDETVTLRDLDIHYYLQHGALHVVDVNSIQALVGRVQDGNRWAIIDQSGVLARALGTDDRACENDV